MSVLGILLHFGRAVIEAHNNAKVRNLMDAPRAQIETGKERPAAADDDRLGARRREGRSK